MALAMGTAIVLMSQVSFSSDALPVGHGSHKQASSKTNQLDPLVLREQLKSEIPLTAGGLNHYNGNCSDRDPEPYVSDALGKLLTMFKHQVRDLVAANLRINPDQDVSTLEQAVTNQLAAMGLVTGQPEWNSGSTEPGCRFPYGAIYKIAASQPSQNIIVVTTSIGVVCGDDTSLYIFERAAGTWRHVFTREANAYDQVSGAQGSFRYAVSPRDASGKYFVVSADVSPWCTSNWQMLRYRAERPGSSPDNPVPIFAGEGTIFLEDEPFSISATAVSFRLEYAAEFRNDAGRQVRTHVMNYRVTKDQAIRVGPIALAPEDFVDEWITLPWDEAAKWSSKSNLDSVKSWHESLQPVGKYASLGEISFIRECSSRKWQVGMNVENPEDFRGKLPEELYFTVAERDGEYCLERIDTNDPSCQ